MKNLYVLIVLCFCTYNTQAQTIEIYLDEFGEPIDEDISGTTIDVYCLDDCPINFLIKNVSGEVINVGLERHKLVDAPGSEDYVSFGTISESDSYAAAFVTPQNPFIAPLRLDIDSTSEVNLFPVYITNESMGCSLYRYYITNADNEPLDSVDVHFCSTVGISEDFQNAISIYPNPAQNQLTINGLGSIITGELTIVDLTGKIVYSEKIQTQDQQLIDLSTLDKGVYSVNLIDPSENELIFSDKLIIK